MSDKPKGQKTYKVEMQQWEGDWLPYRVGIESKDDAHWLADHVEKTTGVPCHVSEEVETLNSTEGQ